jgi:Ca-activated chloride channel family protein
MDCVMNLIRTAAVVAAALAWATSPASAQAGRAQARDGNRLYEEGRFEEAHQRYLEGLAAAPESGVLRYNAGNALYRSDDYQRAMEAYQRAIETGDPALASSAWYNLGNAMYRQQQLEPALEAYKEALRLDPADVDAKHNLERVLEQMQQQQNQDPQDQQDQDEQQEQQDQEQQDQEGQGDQPQQQNPQNQPQEQPPGQGQREPRPGDMTPQEAERLLQAVQEDPDAVNRQRAPATGVRPRRPW